MGLNVRLEAIARITQTGAPDLGATQFSAILKAATDFAEGSGAEQANLIVSDRRTIAASAADDLDLSGTLPAPLGGSAVFTAVKGILVKAAKTNANSLVIGGAPANGFAGPFVSLTDKIALKPGGAFLWVDPSAAGMPVVAGSADLLRIANGGAGSAVDYEIVLLGEGAGETVPTPPPPPNLPALELAASSIVENSAAGTIIGGILNRTAGSTLALSPADASANLFEISGTNLVAGSVATNFEGATSHSVSIDETLAGYANSPRRTTFTITVVNQFEQPNLAALGMSVGALQIGTPASGAITGATAGSTIAATGLPAGLTINGPARTWAWSGSGSAASGNLTLTETLADSANSPRSSTIGYAIGGGGAQLSTPTLALAVPASQYPPEFVLGVGADWAPGDTIRAQASTDNFATIAIEITHVVTAAEADADQAAIGFADTTYGAYTYRARGERGGVTPSNWSNSVDHGVAIAAPDGYDIVPFPGDSLSVSAGAQTRVSPADDPVPRAYHYVLHNSQSDFQEIKASVTPLWFPDGANYATRPEGRISPAENFARNYVANKLAPNRRLLMVPVGVSGSSISFAGSGFNPATPGANLTNAVTWVNAAVAAAMAQFPGSRLVGDLIALGSNDTNANGGADYNDATFRSRYGEFVDYIRANFAEGSEAWAIFGGVVVPGANGARVNTALADIAAAKAKAVRVLPPLPTVATDNLHPTQSENYTWGAAMELAVRNMPEPRRVGLQAFTNVANAVPSSVVVATPIMVKLLGLGRTASATIAGGEFRVHPVGGGAPDAWGTGARTVRWGDRIEARVTASATGGGQVQATVTVTGPVNSAQATFTVTTQVIGTSRLLAIASPLPGFVITNGRVESAPSPFFQERP